MQQPCKGGIFMIIVLKTEHLFDLGTGGSLIIGRTSSCYTFYKASGNYPRWSCRPRTRV